MDNFTNSLTSTMNEAIAQVESRHIERMHADFALLTELTKGAKSYEDIAQRFVDMGLIKTHQPSDSVLDYQNVCEEFVSRIAPLLWLPEREAHLDFESAGLPPRSAPLQTYLAQQEDK
jgi:hypothetical protein